MIDALQRPRGALVLGIWMLTIGALSTNFLNPLLVELTISQPVPMVSAFIGFIAGLIAWLSIVSQGLGVVLIGVSVVLLKIERQHHFALNGAAAPAADEVS